jgi:hypothetical protein
MQCSKTVVDDACPKAGRAGDHAGCRDLLGQLAAQVRNVLAEIEGASDLQ